MSTRMPAPRRIRFVAAHGGAVLLGSAAAAVATDTAPEETQQSAEGPYRGEVEVVRTVGHTPERNDAGEELLTGTVWDDANQDGTQNPREKGLRGVLVSNGRDVVTTDARGR